MITETAATSGRGGRRKDTVVKELGPRLQIVRRDFLWPDGEVQRSEYIIKSDRSGPGKAPWSAFQQHHVSTLAAAERAVGATGSSYDGDARPSWFLEDAPGIASPKPYWFLHESSDWRL